MDMQSSQTGQQKRKLGKAIDAAKWAPVIGAAAIGVVKTAPKVMAVVAKAILRK